MASSQLRYPKKSHRKSVVLPTQSEKLAEFFGIMMGDGGINNPWQANITLNADKDAKYSIFIKKLCIDLFGVVPAVRKRKDRQALVISLASTTIVDFLVNQGLPRGNKLRHGLEIPKWILAKKSYRVACVRGLFDTDGCMFIHKHTVQGKRYRNIGISFSNRSHRLLEQVARILEEGKINPHISGRRYEVSVYRERSVGKYLKDFRTSNERISSVFEEWRDG